MKQKSVNPWNIFLVTSALCGLAWSFWSLVLYWAYNTSFLTRQYSADAFLTSVAFLMLAILLSISRILRREF
jgi:hypothetical protein